jgi:hypothetical protein
MRISLPVSSAAAAALGICFPLDFSHTFSVCVCARAIAATNLLPTDFAPSVCVGNAKTRSLTEINESCKGCCTPPLAISTHYQFWSVNDEIK